MLKPISLHHVNWAEPTNPKREAKPIAFPARTRGTDTTALMNLDRNSAVAVTAANIERLEREA